jgi:hemolysin activation/secretion protein
VTSRYFAPALAALFGTFISTASFAQGAPSGRDEGVPERPADAPPSGIGIKPPAPPASGFVVESVMISRFRFSGLTAIGAAELDRVVAPWTGRVVSARELADAASAVTQFLRQRGLFIAYAYFPDQHVVDGNVELAIVEGKLGRVTLEMPADARLRRSVAERMLSPLQPGIVIQRGEFDTPLLILNDLPGVTVAPELAAGRDPGATDLNVNVADQPLLAGFVRLTNHGMRELGQYEFTTHLRLRDPLGIGDLATAELLRSDTGDRTLGTLSYSLPVNSIGTRGSVVYRNQHARVAGDFEPLGINGSWTRWTFQGSHPFVRNDRQTLMGALSYTQTAYHDRIDAVNFSSETRHRYVTGELRSDSLDRFLGGGKGTLAFEHQRGRVDLDEAAAAAYGTSLQVNGEFHRTRLQVGRTQAISQRSELIFRSMAQFASKNLDAGRELRISGADGVRAYPTEELAVDEGYVASLDFRYLLPFGDRWRYHAAVFADRGQGDINKNPLPGSVDNTRRLSGYGLAFSAAGFNGFSAAITLAWRSRQEPVSDPDRNPRVWFTTQQTF